MATAGEFIRRRILLDIGLVYAVTGAASELLDIFWREWRPDVTHQLRLAADIHIFGSVVAFLHVREPAVRHELNPVGGKHIEERRFLVIAVCVRRIVRKSEACVTGAWVRLRTREQLAADHL